MKTKINKTLLQNKKDRFLKNVIKSIHKPNNDKTTLNYFKDNLQQQFTWNKIVKDVILSNRKFSINNFTQPYLETPQIIKHQLTEQNNNSKLNSQIKKPQNNKIKLKTIIYIPFMPFNKAYKSHENSIEANTFEISNQYLCVRKQKLREQELQNRLDKLVKEKHIQKIHSIDLSNEMNENLKRKNIMMSQNIQEDNRFVSLRSIEVDKKLKRLPIRKTSRRNLIFKNNSNESIQQKDNESIDQIRDSLNKVIKHRNLHKKNIL